MLLRPQQFGRLLKGRFRACQEILRFANHCFELLALALELTDRSIDLERGRIFVRLHHLVAESM